MPVYIPVTALKGGTVDADRKLTPVGQNSIGANTQRAATSTLGAVLGFTARDGLLRVKCRQDGAAAPLRQCAVRPPITRTFRLTLSR